MYQITCEELGFEAMCGIEDYSAVRPFNIVKADGTKLYLRPIATFNCVKSNLPLLQIPFKEITIKIIGTQTIIEYTGLITKTDNIPLQGIEPFEFGNQVQFDISVRSILDTYE